LGVKELEKKETAARAFLQVEQQGCEGWRKLGLRTLILALPAIHSPWPFVILFPKISKAFSAPSPWI
jgi:hypothetical protein